MSVGVEVFMVQIEWQYAGLSHPIRSNTRWEDNTRQMTHMRFNSPVFILIVKILVRIVYIFHRHLDSAIAEYK